MLSLVPLETQEQQQGGAADEAEPFMGSGRFGKPMSFTFILLLVSCMDLYLQLIMVCVFYTARAYLLGYNCADEKELEATLRFC